MKSILLLFPWLLVLASCTTTHQVDWNSRIGTFTYAQAVDELGPPENLELVPDGTRVVSWLAQRGRSGSVGFGMDAGFATPGLLENPMPYETPPTPDRYLQLRFGPDGRLMAWKRFYRFQ
ncbi:MAG: hypothetical protein JWR69_1672 [Pedosphaera sp.]|nr:hypothetical protein [Pedosphaera sp.]